jgi:thiol-disulfide isomerase/thioredoxin
VLALGAALAAGYHVLVQPAPDEGAAPINAVPDQPVAEDPSEPAAVLASADGIIFRDSPAAVPDLTFLDTGSGQTRSLSDFRGRAIVLNVWATWCVPCRREMPSLDRLQARFDPTKLLVLALSGDSVSAVSTFYRDLGLHGLGIYLYGGAGAASTLGLPGIPGTILIDADGKEIGRRLGPAEWDSEEIVAALAQHLSLPEKAGR